MANGYEYTKGIEAKINTLLERNKDEVLLGIEEAYELTSLLLIHPNPGQYVIHFLVQRPLEDLSMIASMLPFVYNDAIQEIAQSNPREKTIYEDEFRSKVRDILLSIYQNRPTSELGNLPSQDKITEALSDFVNSPDWATSLSKIEKFPILLSLSTDFFICTGLIPATIDNNHAMVKSMSEHRELLSYCRRYGVKEVLKQRFPFLNPNKDLETQAKKIIMPLLFKMESEDYSIAEAWGYALSLIKKENTKMRANVSFAYIDYLESRIISDEIFYRAKDAVEVVLEELNNTDDDIEEKPALFAAAYQSLENIYAIRARQSLNIDDVNKAVEYGEKVFDCMDRMDSVPAALMARQQSNIAGNYIDKFNLLKEPDVLDEALYYLSDAYQVLKEDESDFYYFVCVSRLGFCYVQKYSLGKEIQDRDKAVHYLKAEIDITPSGSSENVNAQIQLGEFLVSCAQNYQDVSSIDDAIVLLEAGITETPKTDKNYWRYLTSLGSAYELKHDDSLDRQYLEKSIELSRNALKFCDDIHGKAGILHNISHSYLSLFLNHERSIEILEQSISLLQDSLDNLEHDDPERIQGLSSLGIANTEKYWITKKSEFLDQSVMYFMRALELSGDNQQRLEILPPLANCYRLRFEALRNEVDIEEALRIANNVIELINTTARGAHRHYAMMGEIYQAYYHYSQNPDFLQSAITFFNKAIESAAEIRASIKAEYLARLSRAYWDRYKLSGVPGDLIDQWRFIENAIKEFDNLGYRSADLYDDLAITFIELFRVFGRKEDLDRSLEYSKLAEEIGAKQGPHYSVYLNTLGVSLLENGRYKQDIKVLKRAISAFEKCLGLASDYREHLSATYANISSAYSQIFLLITNKEKKIDAIDKAIAYADLAVNTEDRNSRETIYRKLSQISFTFERFRVKGDFDDLLNSYKKLSPLWESLNSIIGEFPLSYQQYLQSNFSEAQLGTVMVAHEYSQTVEDINQKTDAMRNAMIYAEGNKSRALSSMMSRLSVEKMPGVDEKTIEKERLLLAQLRQIDQIEIVIYDRTRPFHDKDEVKTSAQNRAELIKKLNKVWDEIEGSSYQGSDYVQLRRNANFKWEEVAQLAKKIGKKGAIVSFALLNKESLAFVYRYGWKSPRAFMVKINDHEWKEIVSEIRSQVFDGMTQRENWHRKLSNWVDSIFSAIDDVDFVVMSTHRHAHAIPWAAIPYKGKPLGVKFAFCTIPSLNVLSKIVRYPREANIVYRKNLVIGNPLGDLPGAKNEAEIVGRLLKSSVLIGDKASIKKAKEMLPHAKYVHLATHAKYNFLNPLASSISLSDGNMFADDILRMEMKSELLIASACETGKGEVQVADEIIGLAHVLLMAGTKSVVASLWRISDSEPTVRFMETFYNSLQNGKSKAQALRDAMTKTYEQWPHSYYWAPFILMGDWQ